MTLRNVVFGLAVVFALSVWSWCKTGGPQARAAEPANPVGTVTAEGGTHNEAAARYRTNQSTHWRQVAMGR